jgi:cytochrome c oxidase subunit 2
MNNPMKISNYKFVTNLLLQIAVLAALIEFLVISANLCFTLDTGNPVSWRAINLIRLNETITFYLVLIWAFVSWIVFSNYLLWSLAIKQPTKNTILLLKEKFPDYLRTTAGPILEIVWTIIPTVILIGIIVPSLDQLYSAETSYNQTTAVHVTGHQWYWDLRYPRQILKNWDLLHLFTTQTVEQIFQAAKPDNTDTNNWRANKMVENLFVVPIDEPIKFYITSADVIHSYSLTDAGIKMDAVPARLNATETWFIRPGLVHGYCSELCGIGHGFMPSVLLAFDKDV